MLTAIKRIGVDKFNHAIWLFKCECGKEVEKGLARVRSNITKSCGCLKSEVSSQNLTKYRKENNNKPKKKILGLKFNKLTAIKYIGEENNRRAIWLWECDCSNTIKLSSDKVKIGLVKSCGCINREKEKELYGQNFDYSFTLAARKECYNSYKQRARRSNIYFSLTFTECMTLFESHCTYCKQEPKNIKKAHSTNSTFIYNGIDRVDNNPKIGYRLGNVVACCAQCNRAKGTLSELEFKNWIKNVYRNLTS